MIELRSPLQAQIVQWHVQPGDSVAPGALLVILEAMKMEHELRAESHARVAALFFAVGETADEGMVLLNLEPQAAPAQAQVDIAAPVVAPASAPPVRADLGRVIDRHAFTLDANRPEAVAKRHRLGLRMARENIADLCDDGSFVEYGALAVAAQSGRRSADDLIRNTPADGMVTGIGSVNGTIFGADKSKTEVLAYDATVLAGTQGKRNHQKTDRLLGIALQNRLPVVLFAEGGGGRPGDADSISVAGLQIGRASCRERV